MTINQRSFSQYPPWVQADKVSVGEKLEIAIYKVIAFVPVLITFGLLAYLGTFMVYFYLYPCYIGDFSFLGLPNLWDPPYSDYFLLNGKGAYHHRSLVQGGLFVFLALMLLISIFQTIASSPGNIPQVKEWDIMTSDSHSEISDDEIRSHKDTPNKSPNRPGEQLVNSSIIEDQQYPKDTSHQDYKYLKSEAGPLISRPAKKSFLEQKREDEEKEKKEMSLLLKKQGKKPILKFSYERKKMGGIRMCQRCLRTKPDRCHHCSQCNRCVLKMDHHCPWVSNCIGFNNYKYFLNMLFYTSVTSFQLLFTTFPLVSVVLQDVNVGYPVAYYVMTTYCLTISLWIVITGFFFFHIYLLCQNSTTIEFCEKRSENYSQHRISPYNLGCFRNFQTVLGNNILTWLFPFCPNYTGDGILFEISPLVLSGLDSSLLQDA